MVFILYFFISIELKSFKKVGVKFYYIFLWIIVLERNFRSFATNLPWQFLDTLTTFKMVAFINFEAVTSSNF